MVTALVAGFLLAGCLCWPSYAQGGQPTTNLYIGPITNDVVLQWLWTTQYLLSAEAGPHGSISAVDGWYDAGTNVTIVATPSNCYHFVAWTGTVNWSKQSDNRPDDWNVFADCPL